METLNVNELRKLRGQQTGKLPRLNLLKEKIKRFARFTDYPTAPNVWIFSYSGKYHKIIETEHSVINDTEARELIQKYPTTELIYVCTDKLMCPLPGAFVGQSADARIVKDDQEFIDLVKIKTKVTINKSDL